MSEVNKLTAIELFCGAGGMATGFERAGVDILFANDIDEHTLKTYRANHASVNPDEAGDGSKCQNPTVAKQGDIRDVLPKQIESLIQDYRGTKGVEELNELDLVIGGPPCEGFSIAGERDPEDPRNELFEHFLRIVEAFQPKAIVMENVRGILTMEDGSVKGAIINTLNGENSDYPNLDYRLEETAPWLLNSADYNVPQRRERVFFVAVRADILKGDSEVSEPPAEPKKVTPDEHVSVKQAISDLPSLDAGETKTEFEEDVELNDYQSLLHKDIPDDKPEKLHNHVATAHRKPTQERFRVTEPGENPWTSDFHDDDLRDDLTRDDVLPAKEYQSRHRKLDPDEPSFTVTSHANDEMVHYSDNQPRIMSVREVARIQSFPDDYVIKGPRSNGHHTPEEGQYEQVGNSVPPNLAYHIADHLNQTVFSKLK